MNPETKEKLQQLDRKMVEQNRTSFAKFTPKEQNSIADYLVKRALTTATHGLHKLNFSIMYSHFGMREPPPLLYQYKYKNMIGMSFSQKEEVAAKKWVLKALRVGYPVVIRWAGRASSSGYSPLMQNDGYRVPTKEDMEDLGYVSKNLR